MLTVVALDCVDVDRGVKLSRAEESAEVEGVPGAVWRGPEGTGKCSSTHSVVVLLLVSGGLHLHLLLLSPLYIMHAHQKAVVHDLQSGQELGGQKKKEMHPNNGSQISAIQGWQLPRCANL